MHKPEYFTIETTGFTIVRDLVNYVTYDEGYIYWEIKGYAE